MEKEKKENKNDTMHDLGCIFFSLFIFIPLFIFNVNLAKGVLMDSIVAGIFYFILISCGSVLTFVYLVRKMSDFIHEERQRNNE